MNATSILLWLCALVYAGIGMMCLVAPVWALAPAGVTVTGSDGVVELRAMYGGLQLGMSAFLVYCAWAPQRVRLGLLAGVCSIGGLGAARLSAWLVTQPDGTLLPFLIVVEVGGAAAGALQLWRTADDPTSEHDPQGSHVG